MNTRKTLGYGTRNLFRAFAVMITLLICTLSLTGCDNGNGGGDPPLNGNIVIIPSGPVLVNTELTANYSGTEQVSYFSYYWYMDGTVIPGATLPKYMPTTAGSYTVMVSAPGYQSKTSPIVYVITASTAITYNAVQTGGTDNVTDSAGIVFTFSASVDSLNLTVGDITVGGVATKDAALTGTGTTRTLAITVNAAGLATVQINISGIEAGTKNVIVYKAGEYASEYWNIIWHLDSGAAGAGAYPEQIVKGAVLAKPSPDPTKAGNTFGGWYTDSGLTQTYNFANAVTANLNLYAKWLPPSAEVTVTDGSTLAEKLQWVNDNAQSNTIYSIAVSANEAIIPQTLSYANQDNIAIALTGGEEEKVVQLTSASYGPIFTVESGVTLILDNNITLQGRPANTAALVRVNADGALTMNAGGKITGNANGNGGVYVAGGTFTMNNGEIFGNTTNGSGGGVYGSGEGAFTMSVGKITGNTATGNGGGVYVDFWRTFTMDNGEISGNTANGSGGGVYMYEGFSSNATAYIFTMNNGTISGNTASSGGGVYVGRYRIFCIVTGSVYGSDGGDLSNTVTGSDASGAALYVESRSYYEIGTAQHGTFSGETWTSKGDLPTTDNTIWVEDGELR